MKRLQVFMLIPFTIFSIVSCSSGDSPKAVAEKYLKAFGSADFEGAKKFATDDTDKLLDMMIGYSKLIQDTALEEKRFTIIREKIEGESATVFYTEEGNTSEIPLSLLRVDGKWKVNMTKESLNSAEGGESIDVGATITADSSGQDNPR